MQRHAQTASGGTACACACAHVCTRLCQPPPGCRLPALRPVPFPPGATAVASQGSPVQDGRSGRLVPRQLLGSRPIRTKAQEGAGAVSQKETNSAGGGAALSRPLLPPAAPNPWTCALRLPVGARRGSAQPSLSLLVLGRAGRGLHLLQSRPALVPSERRFWVTRSTRHGGHSDGCTRPPGDHPSVTWPAGRVRSDPWNFPRRGTPPRTPKPHALVGVCLAQRRRRRRCLPPPRPLR